MSDHKCGDCGRMTKHYDGEKYRGIVYERTCYGQPGAGRHIVHQSDTACDGFIPRKHEAAEAEGGDRRRRND